MPILQIEHKVPSYEHWKKAFDHDPIGRKKSGVTRYAVLRPMDIPDYVIIDLHFETNEDAAKMLLSLKILWGQVEGSVVTGPKARILELVESIEL